MHVIKDIHGMVMVRLVVKHLFGGYTPFYYSQCRLSILSSNLGDILNCKPSNIYCR